MLPPRGRAVRPPPYYLARLPWIGPVLGEAFPEGAERYVRLGCAADPLLGEALLAAFLPVERTRGHFARPRGSGWVTKFHGDAAGRFRFEAPLEWWDGPIAGVLMLLLYDRSDTLYQAGLPSDGASKRTRQRDFPLTWEGQLKAFSSALDPTNPDPIGPLPEKIREEIEHRIGQLLEQPAEDLEAGLIELDRQATPSELTFAVASCQYPAGFLDRDVAQRSYERLRIRVEDPDARLRPKCLLLLGDQVYVDATAGVFDPSTLSDRFDLPYERLLQMEPLRHILRRIPTYTMLDDHEIEDNWEPPSGNQKSLDYGREYYLAYQRLAAPRPIPPDRLWYRFCINGFPFFMVDTRTERDPRTAGSLASAHIIKPVQFRALLDWLDEHAGSDVPKFIASPAAFLPRHRKATHAQARAGGLRSDAWDGYPASFDALVEHIARRGIRNVVLLSGDEHISFATKAVIRDAKGAEVTRILSIHSSGLYAPFAFANSTRDALAHDETFPAGGYTCQASTEFAAAGDGFALLRTYRNGARWHVEYLFDREPQPDVVAPWKLF